MLIILKNLGVIPSFSRLSVSNDDPYSECLFKTLKYTPIYPSKPFDTIETTREWVLTFVRWYNLHHHSGIKFVTPHARDILRRKPDKGYSDTGSIAKCYMKICLIGGFPTIMPCLKKPKKDERSKLNAYLKKIITRK